MSSTLAARARGTLLGVVAVVTMAVGAYAAGVTKGQGDRDQVHDDFDRATAELVRREARVLELESRNEKLRTDFQELQQTIRTPASKGACPSGPQFTNARDQSRGNFSLIEMPEDNSAIVLQVMIVQEAGERHVVTICRSKAGRLWYFNRSEASPLFGVVVPASLTRLGFRSEFRFQDPVTYELDSTGVTVRIGLGQPTTFPFASGGVICLEEGNVPEALLRSSVAAKSPDCSVNVTKPWTF